MTDDSSMTTTRSTVQAQAPRRVGLLVFALLLGANGLWMLLAPGHWYAAVPGVDDTGPLNIHFVRDIGITYLTLGVAFLLAARRPWAAGTAATIAAVWLIGHALLHGLEAAFGHGADAWHVEILGIHLPALLAAYAAWRCHRTEGSR